MRTLARLALLLPLVACGRDHVPGVDPVGAPPFAQLDGIEKLAFQPAQLRLRAGESAALRVLGRTANGWIDVTDDPRLVLQEAADACALRDRTLEAMARGTCTIDAKRAELTAALLVFVDPAEGVGLEIDPPEFVLHPSERLAPFVRLVHENGAREDVTSDTQTTLTIEGAPGVATLSETGEVVAEAVGEAGLFARYGELSFFAPIRVLSPAVVLTKLEVTPRQASLRVGETLVLEVRGTTTDGETLAAHEASFGTRYDVDAPELLVSLGDGRFAAIAEGVTSVRVSYGGIAITVGVTIAP